MVMRNFGVDGKVSLAKTDGWSDGWMDGWMDRWINGWMDGWVGGWIEGWMDKWMDGCTGWMEPWVGIDGWIDIYTVHTLMYVERKRKSWKS